MTIPPYEFKVLEIDLCEMQGRCFELAAAQGYPMRKFVPAFMNSEVARRLDSPYSRYQWMGEEYMLHQEARERHLEPDKVLSLLAFRARRVEREDVQDGRFRENEARLRWVSYAQL